MSNTLAYCLSELLDSTEAIVKKQIQSRVKMFIGNKSHQFSSYVYLGQWEPPFICVGSVTSIYYDNGFYKVRFAENKFEILNNLSVRNQLQILDQLEQEENELLKELLS